MSWRTENHAILAIGIAWVVILALSAPAFVIHGEVSEQDAKHEARPRGRLSFSYVVRVYVDSLHVPGGRRAVGEPDGLQDPVAVRLDILSGILLPHELRAAPGADMHLLYVRADQAVAQRPRQRRESTRQKTRHQTRLRRRRGLRRLLVSHTGKRAPRCLSKEALSIGFLVSSLMMWYRVAGDTGEQVPGRVPAHHDNDNGADSQPYPCLYQQLRQPVSIRLPER